MRKIIGIGETVLDIIFKNNQPIGAVPGGSTFNAIISLGRCGANAMLISEVGKDKVGQYVIDFMKENGVAADYMVAPNACKTPVSLAFLNEKNDAEYTFYRTPDVDGVEYSYPEIEEDDIVLMGSYYSINPHIRPQVKAFLDYAHEHGAIIYYDVNFRPAHKDEKLKLMPNVIENLELADIVRGSNEDFEILYGMTDADKVYRSEMAFYCQNFIYTQGSEPVVAFGRGGIRNEFPVNPIETVSTIGAGDNFNAGFIFGLLANNVTREQLQQGLSVELWQKLVITAQTFSADCCGSIYNYVSAEFGSTHKL